MSDVEDEFEDEVSDEAIDAEIQRRTAAMMVENAALGAGGESLGGGSQHLGIESLSPEQLDELIAARSFEREATDPVVKAALAVGADQEAAFDAQFEDEPGPSPAELAAMDDAAFDDFINRNRSYAEGGE